MGAAWYRARASLRGRAWGAAFIGVIAGLAAATVIAGVAGAGRTEGAFDTMVARFHVPDIVVFTDPSGGSALVDEVNHRLAALPEVLHCGTAATAIIALEDPDAPGTWRGELAYAGADAGAYTDVERAMVVRGRRMDPTQPNEIQVDERYAAVRGLDVGSVLPIGLTPPAQLDAGANGVPVDLAVPPEDYTVVGILRPPAELAPPIVGSEGTVEAIGHSTLYLTPAFWAEHQKDVASYGSGLVVDLRRPQDIEVVRDAMSGLRVEVDADGGPSGEAIPAIRRAVGVEARALVGAAMIFGLVAVLLIGQSVRRQALGSGGAAPIYRAMGFDRETLAASAALEWTVVGVSAAVIGVVGSVGLSAFAPIGVARRSDVHFGLTTAPMATSLGALVTVGLFAAVGALAAWLAARPGPAVAPPARVSRIGRWLASAGLGPGTVIGARMALEPGRGPTAVPVRSALLGAVLGVSALTGAVTFAASLDRVVREPALRGWNWDYRVGNYSSPETAADGARALLTNAGVAEVSGWQTDHMTIDGVDVPLLLLDPTKGLVGPHAVRGRLPSAAGEVALGKATRQKIGADIGDTVEGVGPSGRTVELTLVGESVGPAVLEGGSLDEGAVMTLDGVQRTIAPEDDVTLYVTGFLVRLEDGRAGRDGLDQLRRDFPGSVYAPSSTNDIENLRHVQWLPRLLALGVGVLALGTTGHALVSGVRRRRRDLAVLKAVGFRRAQLASVATAQATTLVLVALVVGLPLGVALGQWLWRMAADEIGTFAGPDVPLGLIATASIAATAMAIALAAWPGRTAAATPAAQILRTE